MNRLLVVIIIIVFGISNMSSQEKDKFRMGLDLGWAFASGGGGGIFDLEPKYNITDHSNVGLRIGIASRVGDIEGDAKLDANISFLGTYDHYFPIKNSSSAPFLGGGLGLYILGGTENDTDSSFIGNQFGILIRGGIELGKLRLSLEYNILPKSDLEVGKSVKNSYFGASIGFYVGGGKWKN
jgi:hypothetical protein